MKIAVMDFETDPFKFGRVPKPFAWGFYDGSEYFHHWGDDTADVFVNFVVDKFTEPLTIFAHNGGKFDFLFFVGAFSNQIKIVNGRILEATLGIHTFRDSYAILPIPLKQYGKDEIDYKLMERDVRENHKEEILSYLKTDCIKLFELVSAFIKEFGDVLTVGSAAMREFKKFHKFDTGSKGYDSFFRQYYFGGRCQCFEVGVIDTNFKIYDINSAYPHVMATLQHPVSVDHDVSTSISKSSIFVCWRGRNDNAVPVKTKYGLDFTVEYGTFWTTIHEFNVALDTNAIEVDKILHVIDFKKTMTFSDFVTHFYESRQLAKKHGNIFLDIFYKLILNSAYGKFAQNPENFGESIILPYDEIAPDDYIAEYVHGDYTIWTKPANVKHYLNVATAASITGATRALLLRGLRGATRPLYSDTDSIIAQSIVEELDDGRLGAWKVEASGTQIAIAGKKMYAAMNGDTLIKKASKGVNLPPLAIFAAARGDVIETFRDAPAMKIDGRHVFIERRIRKTG